MTERRVESLISPKGKSSVVWKHFGFPRGAQDGSKATCKICGAQVERAGGTSNLKSHLRIWHRTVHDQLFDQPLSSTQSTLDPYVKKVSMLPPNSERAQKLTRRIAEMVCRDMRPLSIVDDPGFLSLMHEAECSYVVPCRSTISRVIDDMYVQHKRATRGILGTAVDYVCCTTDMWTSRSTDAYISLTCHFIKDFKMSFRNLQTRHFPGKHDHKAIQDALVAAAAD